MILVNGATGVVGSAVVSELEARKVPFRVFVRDPRKVAHLSDRVERATGDYEHPETVRASMRGVSRVFVLSLDLQTAPMEQALAIARESGVRHVVKLSSLQADHAADGLARWHHAEEKLVEASGLAHTFVRPGNFSSNALQWAGSIRAANIVSAPTGSGKSAPIHPRDIGAVIAAALAEDGHEGKAYRLTGPELLDAKQQTEILARVLDKPLTYVDSPIEATSARLRSFGMKPELVDALAELWANVRAGHGELMTDTVSQVLHRPAHTFEDWARENVAAFS